MEKKFSSEVLIRFLPVLAFLYQNGYDLSCNNEEVDEQLSLFNYFKTENDFTYFTSLLPKRKYVNKKILSEELYDIIKAHSYINKGGMSPATIKASATIYWEDIETTTERLEYIFSCKDYNVKKVINELSNINSIKSKIENVKDSLNRELKVLTWIRFSELIKEIYITYIFLSKERDARNIAVVTNINNELYGGIGGYNPNTKEIKCIFGSAISDLKMCKSSMVKVKQITKVILKEKAPKEDDDSEIKHLILWDSGKSKDDRRAQRAVITSSLYGIISLLCLKYSFNLLDEELNSIKACKIKEEFDAILNYCGISIDDIN